MVVVIVVFSISVLSWTPAIRDQIPDGSMATAAPREVNLPSLTKRRRQLRDSRSFVTLSLGMTLALFAQIGLIAHFVSLLAPDLGARGAGLAAGLSSVAAILGRLIVGWLLPARADRRLIACGCLLIQIAGCVMLTIASDGNASGLLVGVILIGLGVGNATSLPPLIAQAEFDRADVARVVALTVAISQAGYAFAPFVFGTLRELGSDGLLYLTAAAVQLGSVMAYLAGRTTGCCGTSATMPPATPSAIRPR